MTLIKNYFIQNQRFILISLIWLIFGMYAGPVIYFILPLTLLLMYNKGMHLELLLGLFFILTLSDSRLQQLSFSAVAKNIYIIFIFLVTIKEVRVLENRIVFYKYFIPFFLIAFFCMFYSPNLSLSFQKTISYIILISCVPNYFLFVYTKYGNQLFKSIVFLGTLILVLGLLIHLINPDVTTLIGRYRGLLGNPNGLGLYVFLFILFFATVNEFNEDLFTRHEKIIIYGVAFFSLVKCGARTSLVTTLMFFFFKKFYKISPILGFIIFIAVVFVYQLVSDNLTDIIVSLGLGEQLRVNTLESGSGRIIAWQFAWQKIQENFYFGRGFNFTEYLYRLNYEYLSKLGHQGAAHNAYLTFWLDTGLVGLISYLIGLIITFYKAAQKSRLAIPFLYVVLFSNNYESWLTASLNPFTIQFLFILSIIFLPFVKELAIKDDDKQNDLSLSNVSIESTNS